jgi:hypothetical protein
MVAVMEAFQHLKRSTRFKAIACLVNILGKWWLRAVMCKAPKISRPNFTSQLHFWGAILTLYKHNCLLGISAKCVINRTP